MPKKELRRLLERPDLTVTGGVLEAVAVVVVVAVALTLALVLKLELALSLPLPLVLGDELSLAEYVFVL